MNSTMPNNVTHLSSGFPSSGVRKPLERQFTPSSARSETEQPHRKFVAKGHDSQLQDAQSNKLPVAITLMGGMTVRGVIARRDKYTITLRYSSGTCEGMDEIYYKHAIESVLIERVVSLPQA